MSWRASGVGVMSAAEERSVQLFYVDTPTWHFDLDAEGEPEVTGELRRGVEMCVRTVGDGPDQPPVRLVQPDQQFADRHAVEERHDTVGAVDLRVDDEAANQPLMRGPPSRAGRPIRFRGRRSTRESDDRGHRARSFIPRPHWTASAHRS